MLYVTYTLEFLLMMGLPFLLAAFLARRLGTRWGLIWVGAVTFIASQVVHIPLLNLLGRLGIIKPATSGWLLVWYAVWVGLMAGLCEELARYLVLRFWLKRDRSWRSALMFGAGHGGAESFILGSLAAFQIIQIFVLRNIDPARLGVPAAQIPALQRRLAALWSVPVWMPLVGPLERVFAICIHLAAAVLVMQAFTRKNFLWVVAAILFHTVVDGTAVILPAMGLPPLAIEGVVGVYALIGIGLIFALRQPEPPALALAGPEPATGGSSLPVDAAAPTSEQPGSRPGERR